MDRQHFVTRRQALVINVLRVQLDFDRFVQSMQVELHAVQRVPIYDTHSPRQVKSQQHYNQKDEGIFNNEAEITRRRWRQAYGRDVSGNLTLSSPLMSMVTLQSVQGHTGLTQPF